MQYDLHTTGGAPGGGMSAVETPASSALGQSPDDNSSNEEDYLTQLDNARKQ